MILSNKLLFLAISINLSHPVAHSSKNSSELDNITSPSLLCEQLLVSSGDSVNISPLLELNRLNLSSIKSINNQSGLVEVMRLSVFFARSFSTIFL